ncbi:MAG: hypothetical protein XE03_1841 [candidate division TA06 bacterium 34_109]|uniref:Uncharacterized protein n=1 Tax=candidate division TA06 bacterium 34_109 TaxID=1635277 RepID=A0A124FZZ3_UNCT6|nr:MAG: hypothetical protein XE03_1841 [candidate division TA06 bacterium 34_109]
MIRFFYYKIIYYIIYQNLVEILTFKEKIQLKENNLKKYRDILYFYYVIINIML